MTTVLNPNRLVASHQPLDLFIVESQPIARLGMRAYFEQIPHITIVGESDSGPRALTTIRKLNPDIVLLDLTTEDRNGLATTQQIKTFDSGIKIVILSYYESMTDVQEAFEAGVDAYCMKDITPERLVEVLQSVLQAPTALNGPERPQTWASLNAHSNGPTRGPLNHKYQLTQRESQVLRLITLGKNNTQIASSLYISIHTVKAHIGNLTQKLLVMGRLQAAVKAVQEGLV